MRTLFFLPALALVFLSSGCSSPRTAYVSQHPELPPEHRRIVLSGTIKYGDPVVGMSKEAIRAAMGKEPTRTEFVDGEEAWVWVRFKDQAGRADPWDATNVDSVDAGANQAAARTSTKSKTVAPDKKEIKTTVFFHGDVANRVQIDAEAL